MQFNLFLHNLWRKSELWIEKKSNVYHNSAIPFSLDSFPCLVHPCDTASNGGCNQICKKRKHKYTCACNDGFVLGNDGRKCSKG